ncbi:MAG: ribosome biogenesis GTPase Der [Flavobacteriales bacterium TMED113]|nr:MAG: ribosome biogenesis GTPase Der [Flavobacteriales bacterium TMED113]
MSNIVAIVGRPNVGKSTLFNRLVKRRQSIVHDQSGVTRDRVYGQSEWNGIDFSIIDTGGYVEGSQDIFEKEIIKQVKHAVREATVIIFVVDVTSEITDLDSRMSGFLQKIEKPVLLVVNKVDDSLRTYDTPIFYKLGFKEFFSISSINGSGTGELLDKIVTFFSKESIIKKNDLPRLCIVGRPNVGKSSLINLLLDDNKNIVTNQAGTTRDVTDSYFKKYGHEFYLVDTAGIRKKGKVKEDLEYYSVVRAIGAIENADVCILMLDASRGMESQDQNIFSLIQRNNRGVIILVNKCDLIQNMNDQGKLIKTQILNKIAPFDDVPIMFISVLNKQRVLKAVKEAINVYNRLYTRISTSKLNDFILDVINHNPPPSVKGKRVKIKYVTQLPTKKPSFAFFCNLPQYIKESYKRFIENKLRNEFDFVGVPIQLFFRKK